MNRDDQNLSRSWVVVMTAKSNRRAIWLMPASFLIALVCSLLLRETFKRYARLFGC